MRRVKGVSLKRKVQQRLMSAVRELQDKVNHNSMTYTERKLSAYTLVQTLNSMILKCNEESCTGVNDY
jgi:hypothetical protein